MRSIRLEGISKYYNGEKIVQNLSLTISAGKFFALLGPSGCGKTTLLRVIGGFEKVDAGKIYLGDTDITDLPIHKRKINTVFQNYALFPHLNVFENIAYGLKLKKMAPSEIKRRVFEILETVHLANHSNKSIKQLSGGQQQRVALARAIVNEPEVLLLDEPLAALDFKLREKMLVELIQLQDKLQTTFIYITHDQLEALTVADQMAIMNQNGQIEQIGAPRDIYEFPTSSFVAQFVGSTNIVEGKLILEAGKESKINVPELGIFNIYLPHRKEWHVNGKTVFMSIRPEKILITRREMTGFSNALSGLVESIIYHGRSTEYHIKLKNGRLLQVFEQNEEHFPQEQIDYDQEVNLYWQKENIVILER